MTVAAHMIGAALLVNAIPHTVQGMSGQRFISPFASPPGRALSSPASNVAWGVINVGAAGAVFIGFGAPSMAFDLDTLLTFAAGAASAVGIARYMERTRATL